MMGLRRMAPRLSSDVARLRYCPGGASSASFDPATGLSATPSLFLSASSTTLSANPDGTGGDPGNGGALGRWVQPSDSLTSPTHRYATTTILPAANVEIASGKYWVHCGSGIFLALSSAVSLTGDFGFWVVIKRPSSGTYFPFAGITSGDDSIHLSDDGLLSFQPTTGSADASYDPSGTRAIRVTRASNVVKMAADNLSEVTAGTRSGTVTLERLLADGVASGDAADGIALFLIMTAAPTAADKSNVDTYTAANWGVSIG